MFFRRASMLCHGLFLLLLSSFGSAQEWQKALLSCVDNEDYIYTSTVWNQNTFGDQTVSDCTSDKNALLAGYNAVDVEKIRITMNGQKFTFDLEDGDAGKFTLKELVTSDGGFLMKGHYDKLQTWRSKTTNQYALSNTERFRDVYHCFHFGLNYAQYAGAISLGYSRAWGSRVRIGVVMGSTPLCGRPESAEGIGMDTYYGRFTLGSGRLQWTDKRVFKQAIVEVFGKASSGHPAYSSYVPIPDITTRRKLFTSTYGSTMANHIGISFVNDASFKYTMTFNLYIKRAIWYWANFLKSGDGERRSPAFWTYGNYVSTTNRWVTGGGTRLHMRFETSNNWNDGIDPDMKLAHGRWYSVALLVDRYHAAVYIDGAVQLVYPIYGEVVPAVGNQLWSMGQSYWAPTMDIDDFR